MDCDLEVIYADDGLGAKIVDLIVEDMLAGEHTLKIHYAGARYEQNIVVSSSNIFFKLDVDIAASKPQ